jgi:hypothetical protein
VLAEPRSTPDGACQTVTQLLYKHGDDDITLMLARTRQYPPVDRPAGLDRNTTARSA